MMTTQVVYLQNQKNKMTEKNSIIKEALLDIKNIESAINSNTKEMLRGVAREEIDSIVKESLMREIYEEEDLETPEDLGGGEDLGLEPTSLDSLGGEEDSTGSLGDIDSPIGGEETGLEMGAGLEPELGMDPAGLGGDEMDMTAASDDEVIAIYKKMSGEDEIEIVGDEVHLNISEPGQYVVKLDDSTGPAPMGGLDSLEGGDDAEYEIELDDESGEEEPAFGGEEDSEEAPDDLVSVDGGEEESEEETEDDTEEEIDEQAVVGSAQAHRLQAKQTVGAPLGAGADNLKESEKAKALLSETVNKYNTLVNESNQKIEEYKTAYSYVKNKLMETVLLNTKLTYVTKLFTENSTTKAEKESILQRFDEVTTVAESKKLKKVIDNELGSRQPITESIDNKFTKGATTSTSKQLNESTAYVDPSIKRIMDLINRVENKQ
jgi:hypothetical protein